jgi:hypothetical protein
MRLERSATIFSVGSDERNSAGQCAAVYDRASLRQGARRTRQGTIVTEQERRVEIRVDDRGAADEIAAYLAQQGATDIEQSEAGGVIPPALPFVIAALIGTSGLAAIAVWIKTKLGCMVVVDARAADVKITRHCEDRNGRVILIAAEDIKIELKDVPPLIDFTEIAKKGVEEGAEAAKSAAEAVGAIAKVLAPETPIPTG